MTRISTLQYKEDDLEEAITKVKVTHGEDDSQATFSIWNDQSESVNSTSLRKRKEPSKKDPLDDLTEAIEDVRINGDSHKEQSNCEAKQDKKSRHDPLKWFGVLVPQALRQSQGMFQRATEQCCHLASLKAHLLHLRQRHTQLMQQKKELQITIKLKTSTNDGDNVEETHSVS